MTDEHVWPQWIESVMPRGITRHYHQYQLGEAEEERSWPAPAYSQTVKRVCARCNNGWMSKLETAVRPLLTPMIQGRRRALHAQGQRTLAAWVFKTIAVLEYVHPGHIGIPEAHRRWIYEHREPPPEAHIWVFGYEGPLDATFRIFGMTVTRHGPIPSGLPVETDAYAATMSIGHFACQVAGAPGFDVSRGNHPVTKSLRQIWPNGGVSFDCPLQPALTSAGLAAVQDSFRDR